MCVRERECVIEREREREGMSERERGIECERVKESVCVACVRE